MFEGQLTDVQVWSSSLSYHDVHIYMTFGYYGYAPVCICGCACVHVNKLNNTS